MQKTVKTNFWETRRVLVTGATGLVGSWLIKELLNLQAAVTAFVLDPDPSSELYRSGDVQQCAVVRGNLEDFGSVERAVHEQDIDTVFHLGAQAIVETAHRSPLPTFETNIRGTYNLLESCRVHPALVKRVVVASSDKAYGVQKKLPYTEDMPPAGRFPYEVSKSCTDLLTQSYAHTYGLPAVIVRCGNIYGGGDLNWSRIVPGAIRSFLLNEPPLIRSNGKFIRDYVYVKDVVHAYLRAAEMLEAKKLAGEAFNYSEGRPLTVLEIVEKIARQMNCRHLKPKILNTARGEIESQYLSAAKARKVLKIKPQFGLDQGLQETIRWYREFLTSRKGIDAGFP